MKGVEQGFRVRLKRDMTRYHRLLAPGAEGTVEPPAGRSAMFQDRYVRVAFELGTERKEIDVLFSDLEVIDRRWVEWQEREKALLDEALQNHIKSAVLWEGRRGGFQQLVVEFSNERPNEIWKRKRDAEPVIESLKARGILQEKRLK